MKVEPNAFFNKKKDKTPSWFKSWLNIIAQKDGKNGRRHIA
jgi:hypothetical protein